MNKPPFFSIIIPTFNHGHFLKRCIQSIIEQSFKDWEAIVINNFSEDDTIDVVSGFKDSRISLVNFRNNGIIAASRNKGIELAHGEYLAFLDSDDWWYPRKLSTVVSNLHDGDILYHDLDVYGVNGGKLLRQIRGRHLQSPVFSDLMVHGNQLYNSSVVVRKEIVEQVGGLLEERSLIGVEDFDLWLRISGVTERFRYIPKSLGAYWVGGGNTTEASDKQIARINMIYCKYMGVLSEEDRHQTELFLKFVHGKIKKNMGLLGEAINLFKISIKSKFIKLRIKSIAYILLTYMIMIKKKIRMRNASRI